MRGTVLLLGSDEPRGGYADHFRANGLLVYEAAGADAALRTLEIMTPDVVVAIFGPETRSSLLRELRHRVDDATSIVVASDLEDCEPAHAAGADAFLVRSSLPSQVLYEIHRALILRRSGRRLPWNW